jgi:hypothetical protein
MVTTREWQVGRQQQQKPVRAAAPLLLQPLRPCAHQQRPHAAELAFMDALLELARAHGLTALLPVLAALLVAFLLPLLLRGGAQPPAAPKGPVTLQPGVQARRPRGLAAAQSRPDNPKNALRALQVELQLASREEVSHDTRRFRFALPARVPPAAVRGVALAAPPCSAALCRMR